MVSMPVDDASAFLQLWDKYKQDLMEDTCLTKAADLAAKQHMLLASDVPDAWKRPQLKLVGRQLRHWTKKVQQPFGAPVSGVGGTGAPATLTGEGDFDAGLVEAIGQDRPGHKMERLCWGTIHSRQKTTCITQTQYHPEC